MLKTLKHIFYKNLFSIFQNLNIHITPNHYYWPIPDTRTLKEGLWKNHSDLVGIDLKEKDQYELLNIFSSRYSSEYNSFPSEKDLSCPHQFYLNNQFFRTVDAEILYCMIRHFKPEIVFEIGSGFSTYLSAQAILKNEQDTKRRGSLIANDPYPNKILQNSFPGLSKLLIRNAQDIPISDLLQLKENDILFIDSTHILKIGGDVQYEYLEILPRLKKGVVVHIHDIFLPAEYPQEWVMEHNRFWTEQYLLQAFLTFNDHFEVLWAGHYMHLKHPDQLKKAFVSYANNPEMPGSFWIRKTK